MEHIRSRSGTTISYDKYGSGPPLVLVHGSFSDHATNWEFVKLMLQERFTVYALARRGRGETEATEGHSLEDEAQDVVTVVQAVGEPVFLLGHSYGADCSLGAAALAPGSIRKLVLYEAAWPHIISQQILQRLEKFAAAHAWEDVALTFFREVLSVPVEALDELRATALWPPIIADARASLGDLRALSRYDFKAAQFSQLQVPVLLQVGSESPRDLYVTDALAAILPDACIEELSGQAHEGMTTAPEMYAQAVIRFLLE
jgi:pimeloyl-ACP methyl ester carboxylesterase